MVDAQVNVKENKVFLRKRCRDHGEFEALLYSDAEMYFSSMRFNKPGTIPLETQTEVVEGCPFPGKEAAAAEFARVLRPGGRAGRTDVTPEPDRLDDELRTLAGWVACLADARPAGDYATMLAAAGLDVSVTEHHDDALARMIEMIGARLAALAVLKPAGLDVDLDAARGYTAMTAQAVATGVAGYALLIADTRN